MTSESEDSDDGEITFDDNLNRRTRLGTSPTTMTTTSNGTGNGNGGPKKNGYAKVDRELNA